MKKILLSLIILIPLTVTACNKDSKTTVNDPTTQTTAAVVCATTDSVTTSPETQHVTEPSTITETIEHSDAATTETDIAVTQTQPVRQNVPTGVCSKTYESDGNIQKQIVYYPAELEVLNKQYPIVAWANGTMCTPDLYTELLKQIAEGGYIVIANYETMAADGTAQIASIDFIIGENNNESSVFYQKADTTKIAVIGHSQGGRSSVNAASADTRIDCLISIAGSNFDYEAEKNPTPSLFLSGENDMIVDKDQWVVPAYELAKGPAVYACLSDAIHTTCCTFPEKYSGYVINWLDAWLLNDSSAKEIFKSGGQLSKDSNWIDFTCKGI